MANNSAPQPQLNNPIPGGPPQSLAEERTCLKRRSAHMRTGRLRLTPTDFIDVENWWDALAVARKSFSPLFLSLWSSKNLRTSANPTTQLNPDPEPTRSKRGHHGNRITSHAKRGAQVPLS